MNFRGAPCVCSWMIPIGRQFASGLSLLLFASRVFSSSAPNGVKGSPSLMFWPMLANAATGGPDGGGASAAAPRPRPPAPPRHSPDRSGLPSAVFGAGAFMSGWPLASLGTFRVGYRVHCADVDAVSIISAAVRQPMLTISRMSPPGCRTGVLLRDVSEECDESSCPVRGSYGPDVAGGRRPDCRSPLVLGLSLIHV